MVRICILFLALVGAALGQTSVDLSSKYSQVTAYNVRPHVLMTAKFAADGQVCEMTLEKRQKTDSGIVYEDTFSQTEIRSLVDDLVPENQRGRNLTRVLNGTFTGSFMTEEYKYENVVVHVDGLTRPAGAAGNRVITITWPKRSCGEAQPLGR